MVNLKKGTIQQELSNWESPLNGARGHSASVSTAAMTVDVITQSIIAVERIFRAKVLAFNLPIAAEARSKSAYPMLGAFESTARLSSFFSPV